MVRCWWRTVVCLWLMLRRGFFLQRQSKTPLSTIDLDTSCGVILPYYDYDTKVIFLAGKVSCKWQGSFIVWQLSLCPETWLSQDLKGRISMMDFKSKSFHFRCLCPLKFAVQDCARKLCEHVLTSFEAVLLSRAKYHVLQRNVLLSMAKHHVLPNKKSCWFFPLRVCGSVSWFFCFNCWYYA